MATIKESKKNEIQKLLKEDLEYLNDQESKENELQKLLKEDLEHFYDQCRQLFIGIQPESISKESSEAEPSKKDEGLPSSSFQFFPCRFNCQCKMGCEHSVLMLCEEDSPNESQPELFENIIVVNTRSFAFKRFLEDRRGFELALLHQMIYLKVAIEKKPFLLSFDNQDADYAKVCHILSTRYPIDNNGEPEVNKWPETILNCFPYYNFDFMTVCYYVAKNLLQQEELLERVLDGKALQGDSTWEKSKWLAKLLYEGNIHKFDTSDSPEKRTKVCSN